MWQPVVADVHVRQVGRQVSCRRRRKGESYPDLEGEVAAVEQHDVAGQGVLAHPPRPSPVSHPCLLLGSASLDLPPREEAQHVAHSLPLLSSKPLSPLLTLPLPCTLTFWAPPDPPPCENPLLFLPHCTALSPAGGRVRLTGAASWIGAGQVAGQGSREGGGWVGWGTFPGLGRHPTSPRVTSDHLGTHTHRLVPSTYMRAPRPLISICACTNTASTV